MKKQMQAPDEIKLIQIKNEEQNLDGCLTGFGNCEG